MYFPSSGTARVLPVIRQRTARPRFALSDLRSEWVGRRVELAPAGRGPEAWLLVTYEGESGWLPASLRTLGELCRAVGADCGAIPGGLGCALKRPLPLSCLEGLEPMTLAALHRLVAEPDEFRLGGFFSSIGGALSSIVSKARDVAQQAARAVASAASAAARAAGSAASAVGHAVQAAQKPLLAGALIAGGVALGIATGGAALPIAGAMVGAGIGAATSGKGSGLGKPLELFTHMGIGAAAGLAAGYATQFVINGGLTQVGSSLFSSGTGTNVGTVGATSAETTGSVAASGGVSWSSLPIGGILKLGAGYVLKGSGGAAQPVSFAPGLAPTDPGMTVYPTAAAGAAGLGSGAAIFGIGLLAILSLGRRR